VIQRNGRLGLKIGVPRGGGRGHRFSEKRATKAGRSQMPQADHLERVQKKPLVAVMEGRLRRFLIIQGAIKGGRKK